MQTSSPLVQELKASDLQISPIEHQRSIRRSNNQFGKRKISPEQANNTSLTLSMLEQQQNELFSPSHAYQELLNASQV